jgi:predicted nucleotidyltransferase
LAALARAMQERGWRWYVFGAQAVVVHGRPRLTADVDVTVDTAGAPPNEVVAVLAAHDLVLRFPLSADHLQAARLLPMVHAPSGMPLDLVIAGPGLDQEILDRSRPLDVGGVVVPVICAEDLVAMKVLAGRRKDLEDVRGVLLEQGSRLDLSRTRDVLAAMEAIVGEGKLLSRLERLVKAKSGGAPPRRKKRR